MIKIIHISDVHFGVETIQFSDLIQAKSLFSKRMIGWGNKRLRRAGVTLPLLRSRLFEQISRDEWDYLVISGDLSTLALEKEFFEARKAIEPLMKIGKIILTPGNHDRYVSRALKPDLLKAYFPECFPFNVKEDPTGSFPIIQLAEDLMLFEMDMASPRGLISSKGKIQKELDPFKKKLESTYKNITKIAIGHYPIFLPPNVKEGYFHAIENRKALQQFLIESDVSLYLHGHIHKSWAFPSGPKGKPISINSAGGCLHEKGEWAGYHKITYKNGSFSINREVLSDL